MTNKSVAKLEKVEAPEGVLLPSQSIRELIVAEAEKKIKKKEIYTCEDGHNFKGKDIEVTIEEEEGGIVTVSFSCPECHTRKILLPNPILCLSMAI